jgi:hypothetical protein
MPSLPPRDGVDAQLRTGIQASASTVSAINRLTLVVGTSLPLPPTGEHEAVGSPSGTLPSPLCALHKHGGGKSTSEAAQSLARVDGTLVHVLWGVNAIAFPTPLCALREHGGGMYSVSWSLTAANRGNLTRSPRVDGTLAHYLRGDKAITELGPSFLANLVFSHPSSTNDGGERRLGGMPCSDLGSPSILQAPSPLPPLQINLLCYCFMQLTYLICQLSVPLGREESAAVGKAALNAIVSALQHWY